MKVSQEKSGEPLCVAGHLQIYDAEALRDALAALVEEERAPAVDLSGVEGCETATVQILCSAARTANAMGKPFTIASVSPAVVHTFGCLGLEPERLTTRKP